MKTAAALIGLVVMLGPSFCLGDMVLDQAFESGTTRGTCGWPDNAQTFTVGLDGVLSAIHVKVQRNSNPGKDLVLDVRTTVGGAPTESDTDVLAVTTIPRGSLALGTPTWVEFDVSAAGIDVRAGDVLAIALRVPDATGPANYFWLSGSGYSGGHRWGRSTEWAGGVLGGTWNGTYDGFATIDMDFRTFVDPVPVPGAVLLGTLGLSVAGWRLRRKRV